MWKYSKKEIYKIVTIQVLKVFGDIATTTKNNMLESGREVRKFISKLFLVESLNRICYFEISIQIKGGISTKNNVRIVQIKHRITAQVHTYQCRKITKQKSKNSGFRPTSPIAHRPSHWMNTKLSERKTECLAYFLHLINLWQYYVDNNLRYVCVIY